MLSIENLPPNDGTTQVGLGVTPEHENKESILYEREVSPEPKDQSLVLVTPSPLMLPVHTPAIIKVRVSVLTLVISFTN